MESTEPLPDWLACSLADDPACRAGLVKPEV
jgi:hypothetical protein